jgi:alpha-glucosidase
MIFLPTNYRNSIHTMHFRYFFLGLSFVSSLTVLAQKNYTLSSPDKSIQVNVNIANTITYSVAVDQREVIGNSLISFVTDAGKDLSWKVANTKQQSKNETIQPVVFQKSNTIKNQYNALQIDFKNGLSLEWRAFDNGVAWHWINKNNKAYKVLAEKANFNLDKNGRAWYPQEDGFFSHNERQYRNYLLDSIDAQKLASLPALFEVNGVKLLITESDLFNYAGMWLQGKGGGQIEAVFPHYPKVKKITSDRDEKVEEREKFIAQVDGAQSFPWRIVMIARDDKEILSNQLVFQLARPAEGDFSWVKPGKVQWDWWHYNNVYNVDFKSGINNATYKYYIDFASKYGIEYVLLDEGWCDTRDLMKQSPDINVEELANYARTKNVSLILWTSWLVLDKQLDIALDQFVKWGIKGIKVDFMQRDDQDMVNYYEKVSKAAAERKMLVDFHGAYKPTGWIRTYPNVMTSEGVLGNEISKFAPAIDPDHTTTLPFIRMAAGPMDFTPGGMLNVHKKEWAANPAEPMTLGTRCNQLAMYVIYESPLQMLCDIPTHYYNEPASMEFLKSVPTEWKSTVPLHAKIGDYVVMAREAKNGDWYIGAMTDWTPRQLIVNLNFLPQGQYKMMIWKDGVNADRNAKDFATGTIAVDRNKSVTVSLAQGGGYVARLIRE